MSTKLSRYSEGVMEAAWLAAIIAVPVFFNIYSSRIFEPDKISLLRTLALIALAAWVVKLVEEGGARWEAVHREKSLLKTLLGVPMLGPVFILIIVYVISTIFSVTPRVSLFGSYQRLQGLYTTLSYIILFGVMLGNLRKRSQVERLITAVIIASLPVSLYGILQRYEIDPVPWGGNVANRIASNMGNSIFVAAYLIMAVPLTIGRIVDAFGAILREEKRLGAHIIRATLYVFIGAVELIAIYMSGSRGPLLGLLAGLFLMFILLSLYWRRRWVTVATVAFAAGVGLFLVALSIPNGPLENLRSAPWIGRFGRVFDTEERTSQVRILIWNGAFNLFKPHEPLEFPDGNTDLFNFLRPLIGYGPESMYVAYNSFYPPELGRVEKRNASPDRSHNETWDSLVITGVAGFAIYLLLFSVVLYYGLKWVGLIPERNQRNLFLAMYILGGLVGGIGMVVWQGVEFIGVGIPFGVILGVIGYLTVSALFSSFSPQETEQKDSMGTIVLITLLAAIVSHFVEINFGIAIVATRTYFWAYSALILIVGYLLPKHRFLEDGKSYLSVVSDGDAGGLDRKSGGRAGKTKRKKTDRQRPLLGVKPDWIRNAIVISFVIAVLLVTLGYDFVANASRSTTVGDILINSMTKLPNKNYAVSYGVLAMILTSWIGGVCLFLAENHDLKEFHQWLRAFLWTLVLSGSITLVFWVIHAGNLAALARFTPANQFDVLEQVGRIGGLLATYYGFIFLIVLMLALFLPEEWSAQRATGFGQGVAAVALLAALGLGYITNLRVIQADIAFKTAEPFTKSNQWEMATLLYQKALDLAPNEDHYYLFLGRSYLEQAKTEEMTEAQDALIKQAEQDLKVAQKINPLNTDHTANLGRLLSWWASKATAPEIRQERGQKASEYYARAVKLSPNNSNLWNEWAILFMDVLRQPDQALQRLNQALELDDQYSWTYSIFADYYIRQARSTQDDQVKEQAYTKAIESLEDAVRVATGKETQAKISYLVSLGNLYIEMANRDPQNINRSILGQAIVIYEQAIALEPKVTDRWKIEEQISRLYVQLGDKVNALIHANAALEIVPEQQQERIQTLINQIRSLP